MPIALVLIGALLIVVAFQNTMGQLAKELEADIPGFFVWVVAIAAILGLGYIPGLKQPSRWLLGLVVLVIVAVNYKTILAGFTSFAQAGSSSTASGAAAAPANPSSAVAAGTTPTAGQVAGSSSSSSSSSTVASAVGGIAGAVAGPGLGALGAAGQGIIANYADPASYVGALESSIGFGGLL